MPTTTEKSKVRLTFEFDNEEAARHFALWLCEAGEQDYWEWMKHREGEESGVVTATQFHYHHPVDDQYPPNDARRFKDAKFLGDMTVRTTCGRLDAPEEVSDE